MSTKEDDGHPRLEPDQISEFPQSDQFNRVLPVDMQLPGGGPTEPKRPRGRPRKVPGPVEPKRPRGRPRKIQSPVRYASTLDEDDGEHIHIDEYHIDGEHMEPFTARSQMARPAVVPRSVDLEHSTPRLAHPAAGMSISNFQGGPTNLQSTSRVLDAPEADDGEGIQSHMMRSQAAHIAAVPRWFDLEHSAPRSAFTATGRSNIQRTNVTTDAAPHQALEPAVGRQRTGLPIAGASRGTDGHSYGFGNMFDDSFEGISEQAAAYPPIGRERREASGIHGDEYRPLVIPGASLNGRDENPLPIHPNAAYPLPPIGCRVVRATDVEKVLRKSVEVVGHDKAVLRTDNFRSIQRLRDQTESWHNLWVMMLHIFGCPPQEIFTWGLRDSVYSDSSRQQMCDALCCILPHPFWDHNVSRMRYALQRAIAFRVSNHVEPLGPLTSAMEELAVKMKSRNSEFSAFDLWQGTKMDTEHIGGLFLRELKTQVCETQVRGQYFSDHEEREQILFYLQVRDVTAVHKSLDALAERGAFSASHVESCYRGYRQAVAPIWGTLTPHDAETRERWDRWIMQVRLVDESNFKPDIPKQDRDMYTRLAYWDSSGCDPRFKQCIFPGPLDGHLLMVADGGSRTAYQRSTAFDYPRPGTGGASHAPLEGTEALAGTPMGHAPVFERQDRSCHGLEW